MIEPNSISTIEKLYDDESTREKFTVMSKLDIILDDSRNVSDDSTSFWDNIDDFLQWGKSYKITIEELD